MDNIDTVLTLTRIINFSYGISFNYKTPRAYYTSVSWFQATISASSLEQSNEFSKP